jgi:hypothetical protein
MGKTLPVQGIGMEMRFIYPAENSKVNGTRQLILVTAKAGNQMDV